ncbi:MAG TPA: 50S ribosomal protein L3 N(5)-glutamine methyltransferase [Paenalcaligenes sp.]|nr:50S ribosomal protein L3 N(5)-glutamine methyltransferase [Paenalcaligenes sp.]
MAASIFPDAQQAAREFTTLRDILRWAVSYFNAHDISFGQGTDNAWDEAVYLGLSALKLPIDLLEPFMDARLSDSERVHLCNLIEQRVSTRLPAAYLTGEAWLQGFKFQINQDCIIPRSPMAELIVQQLDPWIEDPHASLAILDMCTGSGCLAILAALHFSQAQVDAVDISEKALEIANLNVRSYGLQERLQLFKSDLFAQLPAKTYDLILCNPPYVNSDSMNNLPAEFRHEPALALAGGEDGMDAVRDILQAAPRFLNPGGVLILEIGHEYNHFVQAFPKLQPMWLSTAQADHQILLLYKEQLKS